METTKEERDQLRNILTAAKTGQAFGNIISWEQIERLLKDSDRLAAIERQVIYWTTDMPEWAVAWNKTASGRYCWFVGLHIAQEADNPTPQPAPDLRPDEPGPLWLPIIDAPDAGGDQ